MVDPEVKEILDEHGQRINDIEKNYLVVNEKLRNIENGQQEIKNTVLSSNNSILQSVNTMTQTLSQICITNDNNSTKMSIAKTDIVKQVVIIIGTFLGGLSLPDIIKWFMSTIK